MDVDTVPIPAEEFEHIKQDKAHSSSQSLQLADEGQPSREAARPARPKAMTRRRR